MVLSLTALAEPVGSVKTWLRATNAIALPAGWLICDGSTVVDASSAYNGKVLPDMRGRFLRGHASLSNGNFSSDTVYFAGGTIPNGGADSNNLNHAHSTPNHQHNISAGSHFHTLSLNTSSDGSHFHNAGPPGGQIFTSPGVFTSTDGNHSHTVNGNTGTSGSNFFTDADGGGPSTGGSLGSVDNRPAYHELVVIIKIR